MNCTFGLVLLNAELVFGLSMDVGTFCGPFIINEKYQHFNFFLQLLLFNNIPVVMESIF